MNPLTRRLSLNRKKAALRLAVVVVTVGLLRTTYLAVFGPSARSSASTQSHVQRQINLGNTTAGSLYAVTVSVKDPASVQGTDSIHGTIADAAGSVAEKSLHGADLDFYVTMRARASSPVASSFPARRCRKESRVEIRVQPIRFEVLAQRRRHHRSRRTSRG